MAVQSAVDHSIPPLLPVFDPRNHLASESKTIQAIIDKFNLEEHVEGGYFVETDRDKLRIPSPFMDSPMETRSAMTSIHYLLTAKSPLGAFHRNRGRTVHTLHKGRGRYVIIHADAVASPTCPGGYGGPDDMPEHKRWIGRAQVETFVVGQNVEKGERLQWVVDGGKYKCSFLLPDQDAAETSEEGLLISETVVPGFEFADHDFMKPERMDALVTRTQREEMDWMLRKQS